MLSAVVIMSSQPVRASARTPAEAVVRTLSALVPAAVEGLLRDVTIAAPAGIAGLENIADHAGCGLVEAADSRAAILAALAGTRESTIFLIRAGLAPEAGFASELAECLDEGQGCARMRENPHNFITRLLPGLAPVAALLATREKLAAIADHDLAVMSRRLGAAPTLRLRARRVD